MPARHRDPRDPLVLLRTLALAAVPLLIGLILCAPAQAQTARKLELAHVSPEARAAFFSGMDEVANYLPVPGFAHLQRALEIEPDFGLARVLWAARVTGIDAETRTAELDRGIADALHGTVAEAAFAMALRAQWLDGTAAARSLFDAAAAMLPDDPWIRYFAINPTTVSYRRIRADVEPLMAEFPDFAPAINDASYAFYRTGDPYRGIQLVNRYAELLPDNANGKDSQAELMQWEGFLDQAVDLNRQAIALDPTFVQPYIGIADVRQLQGRGADARAALAEALVSAPTAADSMNLQRYMALSYIEDGDRRSADRALETALTYAEARGAANQIIGIHRDLARVAAIAGDHDAVAKHIEASTNPNPNILTTEALSFAVAGMNAEAEAQLERARQTPDSEQFTYLQTQGPVVHALVLVNQGKPDEALVAIQDGDATTTFAKAVMALAEQKRGNMATARLLRDGILSDRIFSLITREKIYARSLVKRIK